MSFPDKNCTRVGLFLRVGVFTTLVMLLCPGSVVGLTDEKANLLRNPGFEQDPAEKLLFGWDVSGTATDMGRKEWHPRTGRWAFGFGNDNGPEGAGGQISQEIKIPEEMVSAHRCFFTVWVLAEHQYGGVLLLKLEFIDSDGQELASRYQRFSGISKTKWEQRRIWRRLPAGTKAIRAICTIEGMPEGNGSSFIWIDDFILVLD